jgi:hypothetical protein
MYIGDCSWQDCTDGSRSELFVIHNLAERYMNRKHQFLMGQVISVLMAAAVAGACASASSDTRIPPAPIVGHLPDPAFLAESQCPGHYAPEQLQPYLSRARLALWLPGTRSVALDPTRGCITVTVESVGGGRLAELIIRSMAVPRRSVLLILAGHIDRA